MTIIRMMFMISACLSYMATINRAIHDAAQKAGCTQDETYPDLPSSETRHASDGDSGTQWPRVYFKWKFVCHVLQNENCEK